MTRKFKSSQFFIRQYFIRILLCHRTRHYVQSINKIQLIPMRMFFFGQKLYNFAVSSWKLDNHYCYIGDHVRTGLQSTCWACMILKSRDRLLSCVAVSRGLMITVLPLPLPFTYYVNKFLFKKNIFIGINCILLIDWT